MVKTNIEEMKGSRVAYKDMDIIKQTGTFLRTARIERSLTGTELGNLLKISQQQVSRYETGKSNITINMLNDYLIILGKSWFDYYSSVISNRF